MIAVNRIFLLRFFIGNDWAPVHFTACCRKGELQATVSRDYLVYSAADIIAHSIEAYFTAEYRPEIIDFLVESNIKTVIRTTEILLNDPQDLNARSEFAWAATLALNGLTHLGISPYGFPNHMIEHSMSAISDVPHGAGLSVIIFL